MYRVENEKKVSAIESSFANVEVWFEPFMEDIEPEATEKDEFENRDKLISIAHSEEYEKSSIDAGNENDHLSLEWFAPC